MKELTFKSTKITPIIINGQPYLGVSQIAMALQYKRGGQIDTPFAEESVRRLYNRHSDEFTPDMTFLTDADTAGGKQQIRVFSLRGCHLLAMFSKTPVAKEFRKWVLDVLEQQYSPTPALDAKAIGGIVKKCASKAIKDELAVLPAPSFNPQALITALDTARQDEESRRCIGMAVTPQEKSLIEAIRNDYYIAVGKVYRAALDAIKS